ncbi:hypothetical protein GCM10027341_15580 [Spirosoma knui]
MMTSVRLSIFLWLVTGQWLLAQSLNEADSLGRNRNERPDKPKFIFELDQRFFYFKDATPPLLSNPTNVWGARVGFLLPANVKVGVGYYFTNQHLNESWEGFHVQNRRLQYATVYVEPYYFRRKFWELSSPIEVGLGSARYAVTNTDTQQPDLRRSIAVPLSVGVSASIKFPALRGLRPLRWFGVNLMTGYRYTLQRNVPLGPSTLNGVYYSISPAVFLDRFYEDFSAWRKGRRSRK